MSQQRKRQYVGSGLVKDLPRQGMKPLKHHDCNASAHNYQYMDPTNGMMFNLLTAGMSQLGTGVVRGSTAYQRIGNDIILKDVEIGIVMDTTATLRGHATFSSVNEARLPMKFVAYVVLDKFPNAAGAIPEPTEIFQMPSGSAQPLGKVTWLDAALMVRDTDQRKRFEILAVQDLNYKNTPSTWQQNVVSPNNYEVTEPNMNWGQHFKVPVHKRVRYKEDSSNGLGSEIQENAVYMYVLGFGMYAHEETRATRGVDIGVRARANYTD